jgi:hypothetical protein
MSTATKILLGVTTLWPFLFLALFFSGICDIVSGTSSPLTSEYMTASTLSLLLVIIFNPIILLIHAYRNTHLTPSLQDLWMIAIVFGGPPATFLYYLLYIWQDPTRGLASKWFKKPT